MVVKRSGEVCGSKVTQDSTAGAGLERTAAGKPAESLRGGRMPRAHLGSGGEKEWGKNNNPR